MIREELNYDGAEAWTNGDFIDVETSSYLGYYGSNLDPQGKQHLLPPDCGDAVLGEAVLDALNHSRVIPFGEEKEIYKSREEIRNRYNAWVEGLLSRYAYKTRRALFKKMASCAIERRRKDNSLTIVPSHHETLEGWTRPRSQAVIIPAGSKSEEIGAALRVAFSRCIV